MPSLQKLDTLMKEVHGSKISGQPVCLYAHHIQFTAGLRQSLPLLCHSCRDRPSWKFSNYLASFFSFSSLEVLMGKNLMEGRWRDASYLSFFTHFEAWKFELLVKKSSHLKFFTLLPLLTLLTNMRYWWRERRIHGSRSRARGNLLRGFSPTTTSMAGLS